MFALFIYFLIGLFVGMYACIRMIIGKSHGETIDTIKTIFVDGHWSSRE